MECIREVTTGWLRIIPFAFAGAAFLLTIGAALFLVEAAHGTEPQGSVAPAPDVQSSAGMAHLAFVLAYDATPEGH